MTIIFNLGYWYEAELCEIRTNAAENNTPEADILNEMWGRLYDAIEPLEDYRQYLSDHCHTVLPQYRKI